jgi:uncharacterized protein with PQ loop repeat
MIRSQNHTHIHKRKRQTDASLKAYPNPQRFVRILDRVVMVSSTAAPLANIPQIMQIYGSQNAGSLSLTSWIMFAVLNMPMFTYGLMHKEHLIIGYTLCALSMETVVIAGILMYS